MFCVRPNGTDDVISNLFVVFSGLIALMSLTRQDAIRSPESWWVNRQTRILGFKGKSITVTASGRCASIGPAPECQLERRHDRPPKPHKETKQHKEEEEE